VVAVLWTGVAGLSQTAVPAFGQQAAPAAPSQATQAPTAGWSNGFFIQSANGENRIQLGAVAQLDGRFSLDDPLPITNTFILRKARPIVSGRLARFFDYRLTTEFAGGSVTVLDAWVETRFSAALRLRSGKDKTPVGYELLLGDAALPFPERALASSLVPNRDIGVQILGDLAGGKVSYAAGIFNGVVDGTSSTTDVDSNSGKDLAGRIVVQPFRSTTTPAGPLGGLGVQIGGSTGHQTGTLPSFRTTASGQTYFAYAAATGATPAVLASGPRHRLTPAVFYFYRSIGVFGEYVRSTQAVARGATSLDVTNRAWEITGSWLLTGEAASTGLPSPKAAFDPSAGRWGAVQLVARYAELSIDDALFDSGFVSPGASRRARAATVGLNWYPVQPVKYYLTYEHTAFDGPTVRLPDNTILFRIQLAF
jgi:phosphate-selective porin OprO/OprP